MNEFEGRVGHVRWCLGGVEGADAIRLGGGEIEEALPNALVEAEGEGVDAVGVGEAGEADFGGEVEEQSQVWNQAGGGKGVAGADEVGVQASSDALVDEGGIGVAIAENDRAFGQSRLDDGRDVLGTVGEKEEKLRPGLQFAAVEKQLTHGFTHIAGARLAGLDDTVARFAQPGGHDAQGRTLPPAFGTFERDEHGERLPFTEAEPGP